MSKYGTPVWPLLLVMFLICLFLFMFSFIGWQMAIDTNQPTEAYRTQQRLMVVILQDPCYITVGKILQDNSKWKHHKKSLEDLTKKGVLTYKKGKSPHYYSTSYCKKIRIGNK